MRVVQIVPIVRVGSGVEAVAHHLEAEWRRLGIDTQRFTLRDAGGAWLPEPGQGIAGRLQLAVRVVWFSAVGSVLARRRWKSRDDATIVICHNDVLFGDVYVNHGILYAAMKARGHSVARMARNPLHLFTWARDALRYAGRRHSVVVNLTQAEDKLLRHTYPRVAPRTVVIGNGVDIDRYQPFKGDRDELRRSLGLPVDARFGVFVGHEYGRKGLPQSVEALLDLPDDVHLIVVGGTEDMIADATRHVVALGLAGRVHFVGRQSDPRPWMRAADVFVFPSLYESYGLVVLEALAMGLPVVATATGAVPELVTDGVTGRIVTPTPDSIAEGISAILSDDPVAMGASARRTAEEHSWAAVARRYLQLFETILEERG